MLGREESSRSERFRIKIHCPFDPSPLAKSRERSHPEAEYGGIRQRDYDIGVPRCCPRKTETVMKRCAEAKEMVFAGIGSRKTTNAVAALLPWTPPSAVVFGFGCVDANLQVREPLGEKVGKLRRRMSRY